MASRLSIAAIAGVVLCCSAPPREASLRLFQAGGGSCALHVLSPTGEVEVGAERPCYSTMTHEMYGVAMGTAGGVVIALGREGSGAADLIIDDGRSETIQLVESAIWEVAVDQENYVVARPDVVGVVERPFGSVRTLAEEYSHLYTASARAFGWNNSRPAQSKFVDWVSFSSQGRTLLVRVDGGERLLSGSADYALVRTETGLVRAARDGGLTGIPDVDGAALGCIWGDRVVVVSAADHRSVQVWSAEEVRSFTLAAPVDELLCGCGLSPRFVAVSWERQGHSTGVTAEGEELDLPVPFLRIDNPGPFFASECAAH